MRMRSKFIFVITVKHFVAHADLNFTLYFGYNFKGILLISRYICIIYHYTCVTIYLSLYITYINKNTLYTLNMNNK